MKKGISRFYFMLTAVCVTLCGCHKNAASSSAFDSAPAEIRSVWVKAVADDRTNDYFGAITGYHSLMAQKPSLTPEQIELLDQSALAANQRMFEAANSGDAAAKDASDKLARQQAAH